MNNKHQELIDKKVVEFTKLFEGKNIFGSWMIVNIFKMHIKDTIDTVLEEERSSIKIDSNDMQKVGDHYWGGDYEPTYYELEKLTESMNEILQTKLKALDKTPPNKV